MSVSGSGNIHTDSVGVKHTEVLIATVPAGAYISKMDIEGYANAQQGQFSITTGNYSTYNLAAGIQIGPHPYTPYAITNGSIDSVAWLTWSNCIPASIANQYLPGASPQTYVLAIGFPLNVSLRQLVYCPVQTDVFFCVGENTALGSAFNFESSFSYYVEWSVYP